MSTYDKRIYDRQRAEGASVRAAISTARLRNRDLAYGWNCDMPREHDIADAIEEALPTMEPDEEKRARVDVATLAEAVMQSGFYGYTSQYATRALPGYFVVIAAYGDDDHVWQDDRGTFHKYFERGCILSTYGRERRATYRPKVRKPRRLAARKRAEDFDASTGYRTCEYEFYTPMEDLKETARGHSRYHGMARHAAYLAALGIARDEEEWARGDDKEAYGVRVTVFDLDGDEVACEDRGGIELDGEWSSRMYLTENAEDLYHEAARHLPTPAAHAADKERRALEARGMEQDGLFSFA